MRYLTLFLGVVSIAQLAHTEEHRLFNNHFLDVGNEWHYATRLYELNGIPMDLSGTASMDIVRAEDRSGYATSVMEFATPWGTSVHYLTMSADVVLRVAWDSGDLHEVLRNNDPLEMYPLWVDVSYENYHFGHGQFDGIIDGSDYTWARVYDTRVTYMGSETLMVPAGTFSCHKVLITTQYTDSDGEESLTDDITWVDPHIGIVKLDTYEWFKDTRGVEQTARYDHELASTNVTPQSFCTVRSLPMDFDGDCRVGLPDFAVFAEKWLDCALDPPDGCWE